MLCPSRTAACVVAVCLLTRAEAVAQVPLRGVADIALNHGTLSGRIVDRTGRPLPKQEVVLRRGSAEVARSVSDAQGCFTIPRISAGQYEIAVGNIRGCYRAWPETLAPPEADAEAVIAIDRDGGRADAGSLSADTMLLAVTSVIAAVIGTTIALDRFYVLPTTE